MFNVRGIGKRYGSAVALQPSTLAFPAGRTTALIGPSGCGKSTLLRLLLGLIAADEGTIEFGGKPVTSENQFEIRRRTGYVIQEGGLFPHLTAEGNVTLMARHLNRPADWIGTRLATLCELTRFPVEFLSRHPGELSGGQRQRVALMRALMLEPETLLLDEPLGSLDPLARRALQDDLKEIFRRLGQTVVLVTHDLAEAAFLADSIVLMESGRVVQSGTLEEFRRAPAEPFVTEFLNAQRPPVAV